MKDDGRRLVTDAGRERVRMAKQHGNLCAVCGRALDPDEWAYIERFTFEKGNLRDRRALAHSASIQAPVGIECASPEWLRQIEGRAPEHCMGCGRGVHYRVANSRRRRPLCSLRCASRASRSVPLSEDQVDGWAGTLELRIDADEAPATADRAGLCDIGVEASTVMAAGCGPRWRFPGVAW
jgi:hypothetical protein